MLSLLYHSAWAPFAYFLPPLCRERFAVARRLSRRPAPLRPKGTAASGPGACRGLSVGQTAVQLPTPTRAAVRVIGPTGRRQRKGGWVWA